MAKTTHLLLAIGLVLTWAASGAGTTTQGHSGTGTTTQGHSGTGTTTQGHSGTGTPTQRQSGTVTPTQRQGGTGTPAPPSVAPLGFTGWTPTCNGSTITLPKDARFANYSAWVVRPTNCSLPLYDNLTTTDVTFPQDCIDTDKSVTLSFQPSPKSGRNFVGGHFFTEVKITCEPLRVDGHSFIASINVTVNDIAGTPTPMTAEPPISRPTMKLVTATGTTTSAPLVTFTLGQADVHLIISGTGGFYILPTICRGTSVNKPSNMYTFFTAKSSCAIDDEILGPFDVSKTDESSADFYPFMFSSGGTVTLTCEVLVCPNARNGTCKTIKDTITGSCTKGPVTQTTSPPPVGRRRRSARESEPDSHVVELTYTVVGRDPALHGQTAAGAGMAVSIPLLAAVASLWIL